MTASSYTPATSPSARRVTPGGGLVHALNTLGPARAMAVIVTQVLAAFWLGIALYYGVMPVGPGLTTRLGGAAPGDFMFFYPVAVLSGRGQAAGVYDPNVLTATAKTVLGPHIPELIWTYPPTMSLLLAPMGWLTPT